MLNIYYDKDADLNRLRGKTICSDRYEAKVMPCLNIQGDAAWTLSSSPEAPPGKRRARRSQSDAWSGRAKRAATLS